MGLSFVVLAIVSLTLIYNCEADLIGDVCSSSRNPGSCNNALRSDPRSGGADLRTLGQIIVEKSLSATKNTLNVAKSFDSGGNKEKAESCIENCESAIDNLNECPNLLKARDRPSIDTLITRGSAALTDVGTCDDEFGSSMPPKLKQASSNAQDYINVLLVIANRL